MEDNIKTITPIALEKMREGNVYFLYPKGLREVTLDGMADMADGEGTFHSIESLEQHVPFSWKATSINDGLEFVHYCFDEDDEKENLKLMLKSKGLVNLKDGNTKVQDLEVSALLPNVFALLSSREIKVIQEIATPGTSYENSL